MICARLAHVSSVSCASEIRLRLAQVSRPDLRIHIDMPKHVLHVNSVRSLVRHRAIDRPGNAATPPDSGAPLPRSPSDDPRQDVLSAAGSGTPADASPEQRARRRPTEQRWGDSAGRDEATTAEPIEARRRPPPYEIDRRRGRCAADPTSFRREKGRRLRVLSEAVRLLSRGGDSESEAAVAMAGASGGLPGGFAKPSLSWTRQSASGSARW
jgi:hypothetical protein